MRKNGFTLVEILAVIFILSLLAVIITPVVTDLIKDNEQSLYDKQVDSIVKAFQKYVVEHSEVLPDIDDDAIFSVDTLLSAGILDKDVIINPKTKENMSGCIVVSYDQNYSQYDYKYMEECISVGEFYTYDYTGGYQTFTAPVKGKYKLEVWGAQGGYRTDASKSGKGGYSTGSVILSAGDTLYIYVGGSGNSGTCSDSVCTGGYNGGGYRASFKGGGGATDMRFLANDNPLVQQSLLSRLIVAGGGGSDGASNRPGGYGGGTSGAVASDGYGSGGFGGTQNGFTSSATVNSSQIVVNSSENYYAGFGFGGFGVYRSSGYGGAGGGGWYGGVGAYPDGSGDDDKGGGGGSGFVYNSISLSNLPSGYLVDTKYILTDAFTTAGNASMPNHDGTGSMTGNSGDGYAKITLQSIGSKTDPSFVYDFVNNDDLMYHTFTASATGYYKFEAWGAQGGSASNGHAGGKGAYTSGIIRLNKDTSLYVYVGGQNGYNGGGTRGSSGGGAVGGGATDIRLIPKSQDNSLASRIMVAGAGGGSYYWSNSRSGGAAGGLTGSAGEYYNTCQSTGGTQVSGGTCSSSSSVTGSFGIGGNGQGMAAGGGGGYYGGAGRYDNPASESGGGGGSSYVSGYTGCIAIASESSITARSVNDVVCASGTTVPECSYHYSGYVFSSPVIIDGNSSMPSKNHIGDVVGNSGNGAVIITYLGKTLN